MKRPRLLAPSRILRTTPRQVGGGRSREALVERSYESIRKGSKSFAMASTLFDRPTREKAWLLYAWCRRCDDIADGQDHGGTLMPTRSTPEDRIEAIRILTQRALDGQPTAEIAFDAFGLVAQESGLSMELAADVLSGFALDAEGWRPQTEADLMRYCYHVAGAVGVMMARVMGVGADDHDTLDRACDLGLAFQLANIARDIIEDAEAGRCYIPAEWLAEEGLTAADFAAPENRFTLAKIATRLIALMELYEASARIGAARLSFRQRWAVLSAARIYGAIGRKVRDRGQLAWDKRVHIGRLAKLRHASAAFGEAVRNRREEPETMPRHRRGDILITVRMTGEIAPIPMTPLDED